MNASASLRQRAQSAIGWSVGSTAFGDVLQFLTMLVLVRQLQPQSYGQFALITSIVGFLNLFSHNNFVAHTLQNSGDQTPATFQDHFTAAIVFQGVLCVLTNLVAVALAWTPTYADVAPFIHLMSLLFVLDWPNAISRRMLEREYAWRTSSLLQGIAQLAGAAGSLGLALHGAGTWSLLFGPLVAPLPFIAHLFLVRRWRPDWSWSAERYRSAWRFGLARTASGIAINGRQLLESATLTATVGFVALGMFGRSIGLAQLFCQRMSSQVVAGIYPLLTRLDEHGADPRRVGALLLRFVWWMVVPVAAALSELAGPVVQTVYGAQWTDVIALLPWAMGWGAMAAISAATYLLLLSAHHTRLCLTADAGMLVATLVGLGSVLPRGLLQYTQWVFSQQVLLCALLVAALVRSAQLTLQGAMQVFVPPLVAAGVAYAALKVTMVTPDALLPAIGWGSAFVFAYVLVLRIGFAKPFAEIVFRLPGGPRLARLFALHAS